KGVADRLGVTYVPAGQAALARALAGEETYLANDGHWSPHGCDVVARELTTALGLTRRGPVTAILGLSAFYHASAAALVIDGEVIAAAQEERFSRKKHDERFPTHAVAYCLRQAKLTPEQLDYIVFYDKPLTKFERLMETYLSYAPRGLRSFSMAVPVWL